MKAGGRTAGLAVVGALTLATWLRGGYTFAAWPQLFTLEHVLKLDGTLRGDWYTSHAAPHWVFEHALALLPATWLEPACALLWVAGLALFWSAFAALAADLGVPAAGTLAAGLIGVPTSFAGFGVTMLLLPTLYPNTLACAAWAWALREAFAARGARAGVWTGLTLLIHPLVGALALVTTAPVVLRGAGIGPTLRYAAAALVTGGFALARLIADFGLHDRVSSLERFDLLARVRLPHHLIYRAFRPEEYAAVALWALALGVARSRLRAGHPAGLARLENWDVLLACFALLCLAGAVASSLGWPLALVEIQTARLSAWVPLLGLLAAAAALTRARPTTGALALFAVPAIAAALRPLVDGALGRAGLGALPWHALEAPALVALMLATPAAPAPRRWWTFWRRPAASRPPVTGLWGARDLTLATALVALGFVAAGWRGVPRARFDADWRGIAAAAARASQPTDVVLTPPDLDGFCYFSHRPVVVTFGEIPRDDLAGWRERMDAVTGNSGALSPDLAIGTEARAVRIAVAYDATVASAPGLVRRYDVKFVVARRAALPGRPVWAEPVAANATYVLLRVRPELLR